MSTIKELQKGCHNIACDKGFWEKDRNDGELLMLIVSELGECLEGLRSGNSPSDKIPNFSSAEEELADAIIRILDMAEARNWDIESAIKAKLEYNKNRPYKHNKKF